MTQCGIVTISEETNITNSKNYKDLITYLGQSKLEYEMNNYGIRKEMALEYANDKILDYESFHLIETVYDQSVNYQVFSNCYDDLKVVLDEHQDALWAELAKGFDQRVTGRSKVCFNAMAKGFVEGVMEIWSEIKDQVQ